MSRKERKIYKILFYSEIKFYEGSFTFRNKILGTFLENLKKY